MSNFDFLDNQPQFKIFYKSAVDAEKALSISPTLSVIGCRRSMECATKWIYRAEPTCIGKIPIPETLINLMNEECYRNLLDDDLYDSLHLLRKYANKAVHSGAEVMRDEGVASLWVLFQYYDWIDQFYGSGKGGGTFSQEKIEPLHKKPVQVAVIQERGQSYPPQNVNLPKRPVQTPLVVRRKKDSSGWRRFSLPRIKMPNLPSVSLGGWTSSAKAVANRVVDNVGVGLQRTRQTLGRAYDTACSTAERVATYSYDVVHEATVSALKVTMNTALVVPEITADTLSRIIQRGPIQRTKYIRPKADARTRWILESEQDDGDDAC